MAGISIEVKIDDRELQKAIQGFLARSGDLTPAMEVVGNIVRTSIVRNFEKGGRPKKWKKHGKQTEKRRGTGAHILRDEGHLMESIKPKAYRDRVVVGTNKVYAAIHHFGSERGKKVTRRLGGSNRSGGHIVSKPYEMNIPARPYMMVQDEDWDGIKDALSNHIFGSLS